MQCRYLLAYEDGTDGVPKVDIHNSDAGEISRRKHTTIKKMFTFQNIQ